MVQLVFAFEDNFKNAVFKLVHAKRGFVPAVHISHNVHIVSTGCPFSVVPGLAVCTFVEAEIFVAVGKVHKLSVLAHKLFFLVFIVFHPLYDVLFKGQKVGIILKNAVAHFFSFSNSKTSYNPHNSF